MKIGDIISKENYTQAALWAQQNNATLAQKTEGVYFLQEIPIIQPSYAEKRAAEYPPITEQLDMIYWDKINGTNLWCEKITAIKAKYPKE